MIWGEYSGSGNHTQIAGTDMFGDNEKQSLIPAFDIACDGLDVL